MTLNPGMTDRLVHLRGAEIIVTACAFHFGQSQEKKPTTAIVAAPTVRAISTTIAAMEDRKSDSSECHVKTTAVTGATPHAISRLRGASRLLGTA